MIRDPASQRQVGGWPAFAGGETSVVAREDHQSVLRKTEFIKPGKNFPDRQIHRFYHAGIDRMILNQSHIAFSFASPFFL